MKTALLSVYHKDGIVEFAKALLQLPEEWRIISSGGTYRALVEGGVSARDIAEITGMGPILDHRVVTLHPAIHGGLLATDEMKPELEALGFPWIDMVCVDLYPLREEIENSMSTPQSVLDKTDIGGPTMIRSAAKGGRIVIARAEDRRLVLNWLARGRPDPENTLNYLRARAETIVADYCETSHRYWYRNIDLAAIQALRM